MTTYQTAEAVQRVITVDVGQERAFRAYTEEFGAWWPKEHHIAETDLADVVVEPRAGGRWFERSVTGAECDWGRVLAYEPFARVVFGWHLDGDWAFDPDPAHASEAELRFVPEGPDRTRVELVHRHFERHGAGAESVRGGVSSSQGYDYCLRLFTEYVNA